MFTPPYLKKGDKVIIVAPARKISKEIVDRAKNIIESWNLKVEYGQNLFNSCHQFSGNDAQRLSDFQYALDNPDIKAIFCSRGGYGSVRLIDKLNFDKFLKYPKWIIGYSDITVFHSHINENFNIETLHAEMPLKYANEETKSSTLDSLKNALLGKDLSYQIPSHKFNRKGKGEGILTGGNLSMLYSIIGSSSDINTKDKLLFIEDLDEYLYHIDRMMMNLKRTGKLKHLAGMIVGGMTGMNDNPVKFGKSAMEIIKDIISEYNFPVCYDFPAGHIADNRALIMGRKVKFTVDEKVKLIFR